MSEKTEGYVNVYDVTGNEVIGRMQFPLTGELVGTPSFISALRWTGTPPQRLAHMLEQIRDDQALEDILKPLYQLLIDALKGNVSVDDLLVMQDPIRVPMDGWYEFKDTGRRTIQLKYKMKGGPR
jgi:hypothetical protein